jgi:hypothetical protein
MKEVFSQAALASKVSMPMKLAISMALAAAVALTASSAHAEEAAAKKSTQTHKTNDYVEQSTIGGDSVVSFTGDELAAPPGGAYGDIMRRPPGIMRVGLIRPRMNFVMEMLKSVENL